MQRDSALLARHALHASDHLELGAVCVLERLLDPLVELADARGRLDRGRVVVDASEPTARS